MSGFSQMLGAINKEIASMLNIYKDISVTELATRLDVNLQAKNGISSLISKMITDSKAPVLTQFIDEGKCALKTIRLDKYGQLKESMSLPTFRYCEIVKEEWKTSTLRNFFADTIFTFVVFQIHGREYYLQSMFVWKMPADVLDDVVSRAWCQIVDCLKNGNIVKYIDDNGRYFSSFPSSMDNPYIHVRPHARDRNDTYQLPVADKLTGMLQYPKHSFWLNRSYILKIISNNKNGEKHE
jgi:hypothetical protein